MRFTGGQTTGNLKVWAWNTQLDITAVSGNYIQLTACGCDLQLKLLTAAICVGTNMNRQREKKRHSKDCTTCTEVSSVLTHTNHPVSS